ncbi:Hypothetical protein D9617_6g093410 [Elsinoe fawcettii]|nr:Hypothetical protein D9617_6g093410 [Elsinoe fawcettii]
MSPYLSPSTSPSSSRSTSPNPSSPTSLYTISIRITCHCHTLTHILPLPSSSLPLSSALCHCTRCRTTFGSLFSSWVELSGGASSIPADSPCAKPPEELLQKLVQLPFTEKTRLYACGTCGATVFLDWDGGWLLGSGLVDWGALRDEVERVRRVEGEMEGKGEVGLVRRVGEHLAVEHTGDGGAGVWLSGMEGRESDYQSAALGQEWRGEMLDLARRTTEAQGEIGDWIGNVEWSCACGNVSGWLTREDGKGDKFGLRREEHDRKFRGVVSTGKSEGQCNGFEVGAWVVVPRSQIRGAAEMKEWLENIKLGIPQDDADPGIGMYRSSPGVERYWCRTCGARLLLMERKRPGFVKITAGLLRSLTGARAEDWVGWEMDKSGEHAEKALTRDIEQGLQAWNEAMKSALERTDSKQ